ncbi:acetyl-CoA carboxylase family protein [Phytohabitans kaempferiae]|uniref:acetyl-CoA carboxylase n=1 Tax=Phytohabitans kaempferiae TaxID=1620943 RepID=A0ABV6M6D8_9ACTN
MSAVASQGLPRRLLVANRGEIAIRVARTARDIGITTVVVYPDLDRASAHVRFGDVAHRLAGTGAYLDAEQLVEVALENGCDAVHPGYGFLSENAAFARRCVAAGIRFVGPRPELIELFGDKARARALATSCGVPVVAGTDAPATLDEAADFLASLGPGGAMIIKAVAGGGGRGMRVVTDVADLPEAYARCRSEAERGFGTDAVYVERYIARARHVEVQVAGDGSEVSHFWERECSLQRRHQKLVEVAPSPSLTGALRERLFDATRRIAAACRYDNVGTFEFLVDVDRPGADDELCFIEANPRIQVEHTVTEEILGVDLVRAQVELAAGRSLAQLSLRQADIPPPRGHAIQLRVNTESLDGTGEARPGSGTITAFAPPGGPGVRVDTYAYVGYRNVALFDSLLAKLVVSSPEPAYAAAVARARRALAEFDIEGVPTNLAFLRSLLDHPDVAANTVTTRFVEEHAAALLGPAAPAPAAVPVLDGAVAVSAPLSGVVVSLAVAAGDRVQRGAEVAVVEAMKMEHVVTAATDGLVRAVAVGIGDLLEEGAVLALLEPLAGGDAMAGAESGGSTGADLDNVRADLATLRERIHQTLDEGRPDAVERRRARGQRTVRENLADLFDPGTFTEYGQLAVAFQRSRHDEEKLRELSPADGHVTGVGSVNGEAFGPERAKVAVAAYDATVFAGTQGYINHQKSDRLFHLALDRNLPVVLFAEGGGGRSIDDPVTAAGLYSETFTSFARLGGRVPLVGIASGRCFAGNAALLGLTDVIIATENSTIGMGGPALIEAAGLGAYSPEQVGPIDAQSRNGVVDVRVADEAAAVATAKRYLSYFQGRLPTWEAADPRRLRSAIPENRLRAYDVRQVARLVADTGSYLELRPEFGAQFVTALVRVEGRPLGLIANNPSHQAGAIYPDAADKAARFLRLCDAHGLPVLSLIDTPGIMVGPDAERGALVRHAARLFAASANIEVPIFAVVLRKAYGLGAMASAGGHFRKPYFTVAWPTGEFGGMGLEGAIRLGYRHELAAIEDPAERQAWFEARVAELYAKGRAVTAATYLEFDAVIDPAETRSWIVNGLDATATSTRPGRRTFIDTW